MFEPENRQSLSQLLAPQDGEHVSVALAATYSVDMPAIVASLCALNGRRQRTDAGATPEDALHDALGLRDRFAVLFNQAHLQPFGDQHGKAWALFDRHLLPVRGGLDAFHPKVWLIRVQLQDVETIAGRAIASSAEAATSRQGTLSNAHSGLTDIEMPNRVALGATFLSSSRTRFSSPAKGIRAAGFWPICRLSVQETTGVRFALPGGGEPPDFRWQRPGGPPLCLQLTERLAGASQVILVAPFIGRAFLRTLGLSDSGNRPTAISPQVTLVSTSDALSGLGIGDRDGQGYRPCTS